MRSVKKTLFKGSPCLPLIALALAGCATVDSGPVIKAGDKVGIHFTCRLPDGRIAASTNPESVGEGRSISQIYMKRGASAPLVIEAGAAAPVLPGPFGKSFEDEIIDRLAFEVVGMKQGEAAGVDLVAERIKGLSERDQFIKIPRVRKHPKEMKLTKEGYKKKTGKDAVVDQQFIDDPALPGKVASITGEEVLIRFAPASNEVETPFGKATVWEKENQYEIDIDAVKGGLVRSGPLVGRIIDADAATMKLDYGHPFGGEPLKCDVNVMSVQPGEKKAPVGGDKVDNDVSQTLNDALAKAATERSHGSAPAVQRGTVERGDLVRIDYTAALDDGAIFSTTMESVVKDPGRKKVSWFREPAHYAAEELVAGKEELVPGLGDAVMGLGVGAKKQIRLTPDKAFGRPDPQKQVQLPCSRTFPRVVRLPADEYVKRFSSFPVLNKEVDLVPYFKARVMEVTERDVALEFLVKNGEIFTDSSGTVSVIVVGDKVTTTLKPVIGAEFPIKDETGIITATDGVSFTVDTNNPLAGKSIVVDLAVVSLTKAAALQMKPIDWIEEYVKGLAKAKEEGKPVFLLLYADWCGWCKKTMTETIPDPRINGLKDKFIWVKVNSDKEKKYKELYGQNGFPMMIILKPDGTVLKKIDGFRDARRLKAELDGVL